MASKERPHWVTAMHRHPYMKAQTFARATAQTGSQLLKEKGMAKLCVSLNIVVNG